MSTPAESAGHGRPRAVVPQAQLRAAVRSDRHSTELRIEDDGSGIEPEVLPHIFDRFYRSDPSRSRKTGGTGLGLAICKAIVARAQGTIGITSEPGRGTIVMIRFPLQEN